jgi:DNA-binding NtrC family response regulator
MKKIYFYDTSKKTKVEFVSLKSKNIIPQIIERLFGHQKTGEVDGVFEQKKSPRLFGGGLFGLVQIGVD